MATSKDFIHHFEQDLSHIPTLRTKAMFGEYAYYCNDVVVGLICDETIYLKITPQTEKILDDKTEKGPPYPGAKDQFILDEKLLEDKGFMKKLIIACSEDVIATKKNKEKEIII